MSFWQFAAENSCLLVVLAVIAAGVLSDFAVALGKRNRP